SSDQTLIPNSNLVATGNTANRTLMITPAANQFGSATITVTVTDGNGGTASTTFQANVTAVNDPQTISSILNQTTPEDTALSVNFSVGDVETPSRRVVVRTTSSDQTLIPNGNLAPAGNTANRSLMITPAANQSGAATITVTVA